MAHVNAREGSTWCDWENGDVYQERRNYESFQIKFLVRAERKVYRFVNVEEEGEEEVSCWEAEKVH